MSHRAGQFVTQPGAEPYRAFFPAKLPPHPPLNVDTAMQDAIERATLAVGRLDGLAQLLPDPQLFLYMYIRKEAVLSSQIEGTQSSLSDLLAFENEAVPGVPISDVQEVSSYVRAMTCGLELLKTLPLCTRLLCEVHRALVAGTRGGDKAPGEVRRTQNWIGGSRPGNARYVPPPPHAVGDALSNLDRFLNDETCRTPPVLKAGIAHAQFETIHPFLDGNGRVGRLLITLVLVAEQVLAQPLLYVSLHFKAHRQEYYDRLQRLRTHGDWEGWMHFYLDGVASVSVQATKTARTVAQLFERDRERVLSTSGKGSASALKLYELVKRYAVISIPSAAKQLQLAHPTVADAVKRLMGLGILTEATGKLRDRQFLYKPYVAALTEDTKD
ncbi:MAG: Fic family protein [Polyangiaceae bacterium]|nr:Fic family protein [Polyangiaceae bacterium]